MKNKRNVIGLILIIIVSIVALVVGWHEIFNASKNPNLIVCKDHIDLDYNMACDNCGVIFSKKYELFENELQFVDDNGVSTSITGNMPADSKIVTKEILSSKAAQIAKEYNLNLDEENILLAYDMSIEVENEKYQPIAYNEKVTINISNLDLDLNKSHAILHIKDNKELEAIYIDEISEDQIKFKATSFSTYIIVEINSYNVSFTTNDTFEAQIIGGGIIKDGDVFPDVSNFNFVLTPADGYFIKNITIKNESGVDKSDLLILNGTSTNRKCKILAITENLIVDIETGLVPKRIIGIEGRKVSAGTDVVFRIKTENTTTYEWQYKINDEASWENADTIGKIETVDGESRLTLEKVTLEMSGYLIRCIIGNDACVGDNRVISNKATLIVEQNTENYFIASNELNKTSINVGYDYYENALITEWTLPEDNKTITLPIQGNADIYVFWGDGAGEKITGTFTTDNMPTHKYEKAGTYNVIIGGTLDSWGYTGMAAPTLSSNAEYYTYTQYLTALKGWGELDTTKYGFSHCINLSYVSGDATENSFKKLNNMDYMFAYCKNLKTINLSNVDTSTVTSMAQMFINSGVTHLDLSNFNTDNVKNFLNMFSGCTSLESVDVSSFTATNAMLINAMFSGCSSLKSIQFNNFVTSNVNNMSYMFSGCSSLETLNIASLSTENVTTMNEMFSGCSKLTEIDVNHFNTSSVTNMQNMFSDCKLLTNIDISNFDTRAVTNMQNMFYSCSALNSILVSNKFIIYSSTTYIFSGCSNLSAIITISSTPAEAQFNGLIPSKAKLYVPNGSEDDYKQTLTGDTAASKIAPMLQIIGKQELKVIKDREYIDEGFLAAGFTKDQEELYGVYGYNVEVENNVDTSLLGKQEVKYTLTRSNENGNLLISPTILIRTLTIVEGTYISLYENNEIYDSNWTNQNVLIVMTPVLDESTWVEVKLDDGEWSSNPTFGEIKVSGDSFTLLLEDEMNSMIYVKEIDENGNDTLIPNRGYAIRIDKTAPIISNVKLIQNNENSIIRADVIEPASGIAYYAVSEDIKNPVVWNVSEYADNNFQCEITIDDSIDTYYLHLKDAAGNAAKAYCRITMIDVIPPIGGIAITDLNEINASNYIDRRKARVEIFAEDNKDSAEKIEYYISTTPITNTDEIPNTAWKQYANGLVEEITLPKVSGANAIYVVFRDSVGNTSRIYVGGNAKYKITYDANGGTNAPESQTAYYGMPITLSNKKPINEGKYFIGWSLTKENDSANYKNSIIYKQGEFVTTDEFDKNDVTLYAVWTDKVEDLPLLYDRVKVGDYVNYPVFYENVTVSGKTANLTGWRVLNKENGKVNLISAGVPLTYLANSEVSEIIDSLENNFVENTYMSNGFTSYESLEDAFSNKYTEKTESMEPIVRTIKKEELDLVYDKTGETLILDGMSLTDERLEKMLAISANEGLYVPYLIGSENESDRLWLVGINGTISNGINQEIGVRVVVTLKENAKTAGFTSNGVWELEAEDEITFEVSFNADGGIVNEENTIVKENGKYGNLPIPTRTGYIFLGWYDENDQKIEETTIVSKAENHTLYAKWEKVLTVGEYVDYGISYTDVYTKKAYNTTEGWRVLSAKDKGNGIADIELISTGVPAYLYYYYSSVGSTPWSGTTEQMEEYANNYYTGSSATGNNMKAASGLMNNLDKIVFTQDGGDSTEKNVGTYLAISGSENTSTGLFKANNLGDKTIKVRSIMHKDITGDNGSTMPAKVSDPTEAKGLFVLKNLTNDSHTSGNYWLASPAPQYGGDLRYISNSGSVSANGYNQKHGLRPVISITDVKAEYNGSYWVISTNGDGS